MNEASKILPAIMHLLKGKSVLDLGCGDQKVVPWAIGVDSGKEWPMPPAGVNVFAYVDPGARELVQALETAGKSLTYDVVFSSHTLEHLRAPIRETIEYWLCFVSPGCRLILLLPDETRYCYDPANPKARNPAHIHLLTPVVITWSIEQLHGVEIEENSEVVDYSVLVVLRKL